MLSYACQIKVEFLVVTPSAIVFFFFMRMKAVGKLSDGEFPNTSVENSQVSEIRAIPPGV